jgi:hypothetical protein
MKKQGEIMRVWTMIMGTGLLVLCGSIELYPYSVKTHRELSRRAVLTSQLSDFLRDQLDISEGVGSEIALGTTIVEFVQAGSENEDNTPRYCNHFHNPLLPWSEAQLLVDVPIPSRFPIQFACVNTNNHSSLLWGQRPELQPAGNSFVWQDARRTFLEALTTNDQVERVELLTRSFETLGHLIHLVQDAAQPAHTRNDPHLPFFAPFEEFVEKVRKNDRDLFDSLTANPSFDSSLLSLHSPAPIPIANLIDRTDSRQQEAAPSAGFIQGLAEYSNANFLSRDTVFEDFQFPRKESLGEGVRAPNGRIYYPKISEGEVMDHFVGRSFFYKLSFAFPPELAYVLDDRVFEDYASLLLPRAIGYSAGLLDYFFRGRMKLTVTDLESTNGGITAARVTLANRTPGQVSGIGTLVATVLSEGKVVAVSQQQTVALTDIEQEVAFDFSHNPIPVDAGDLFLTVVYRGPLGLEADAVMVGGIELFPSVFVLGLLSDRSFGLFGLGSGGTVIRTLPLPGDFPMTTSDLYHTGITSSGNSLYLHQVTRFTRLLKVWELSWLTGEVIRSSPRIPHPIELGNFWSGLAFVDGYLYVPGCCVPITLGGREDHTHILLKMDPVTFVISDICRVTNGTHRLAIRSFGGENGRLFAHLNGSDPNFSLPLIPPSIVEIDPDSCETGRFFDPDLDFFDHQGHVTGLAFDGTSLLVSAPREEEPNLIVQMDPDTEEIVEEWPLDFRPLDISAGPGQ